MAANRTMLFPYTRRFAARVQDEAVAFCSNVGVAVGYTGIAFKYVIQGKLHLKQWFEQAAFLGWQNLAIALIMTTFSGMVIALQTATEMVKQGAGTYVGALVSLSIVRELAPIMTSFSVIAMAGSAFAAELSTMKISSQVDALKMLHVDPIRYLLVPRVMACIVMIPLMTIITAYAGILGGLLVSTALTDLQAHTYMDSVKQQTDLKDIFTAILKSGVFGYLIAIISVSIGMNTSGGSREVGVATTRAVVWSFVAIAIFDYILTYMIYGSNG